MKEIKQLTDAELQERLETLSGLKEAEGLRKQIEDELAAREKAREDEKREIEKESEKSILRKQHEILGKYYKVGDKHYKVIGVLMDKALLETTVVCKMHGYESEFNVYSTSKIDDLLKDGKEITKTDYTNNKFSINQRFTDVTRNLYDFIDTGNMFLEIGDMFRGLRNFRF